MDDDAPLFFAEPRAWRAWLEEHHETARAVWAGFYKKGSGRPSMTWPESVDEALCFGWIDGVRRGIDEHSYMIRFTPRRRGSIWSKVNIARVQELAERGLMRPAGMRPFAALDHNKSGVYAFEQGEQAELDSAQEESFRANAAAWAFFSAQPPSYRRTAIWWVVSAKRDETRTRRLATLIDDSARGRTIAPLTRPPARPRQGTR